MIYSSEDAVRQLAKQPGWQDVLTKLYVKESYESHTTSLSSPNPSLDPVPFKPLLKPDSGTGEGPRSDVFNPYNSQHDEGERTEPEAEDEPSQDISESITELSRSPLVENDFKNFGESLNFKPFDSTGRGSRSSSLSNALDVSSSPQLLEEEEGTYQPLSPFGTSPLMLDLAGQKGPQTPETPSPLENSKPFPGLRPRKSSSLSNVLDETSYCNEPSPADTISNNSNPQVRLSSV